MLPKNDGTFLLSWLDGRNTGGGDHDYNNDQNYTEGKVSLIVLSPSRYFLAFDVIWEAFGQATFISNFIFVFEASLVRALVRDAIVFVILLLVRFLEDATRYPRVSET